MKMNENLKVLSEAKNLKESLSGRSCECCGGLDFISGVASSSLGPVSILWCHICLNMGADTLPMIKTLVETCSGIENIEASLIYFDKDKDSYIDYKTKEVVPFTFKDGTTFLTKTELTKRLREINNS